MATARKYSPSIGFVINAESLDDKDKAIIDILVKNSKTTTTEIANKLRISDVATRRRIKKLEDHGVIIKYTTMLNPFKLGYNAVVKLFIEVEPKSIREVAQRLSDMESTTDVITVTGQYSVMTTVWVKNHYELVRVVQEIGKVEGVRSIVPVVVTSIHKINGMKIENGNEGIV